jgi:hypothetical protein
VVHLVAPVLDLAAAALGHFMETAVLEALRLLATLALAVVVWEEELVVLHLLLSVAVGAAVLELATTAAQLRPTRLLEVVAEPRLLDRPEVVLQHLEAQVAPD